jgi:hypothetical protein
LQCCRLILAAVSAVVLLGSIRHENLLPEANEGAPLAGPTCHHSRFCHEHCPDPPSSGSVSSKHSPLYWTPAINLWCGDSASYGAPAVMGDVDLARGKPCARLFCKLVATPHERQHFITSSSPRPQLQMCRVHATSTVHAAGCVKQCRLELLRRQEHGADDPQCSTIELAFIEEFRTAQQTCIS